MTRWLTVMLLVLATGVATAAPVPKALKKAKPAEGRPFAEVMTKLEGRTKLLFLSTLHPRVTLEWPEDPELTAGELFDKLNTQFAPEGFVLVRKTLSFRVEVVGK